MRKLIVEVQISVDGFIGDKEGTTKAWVWNWSDDWTWDEALRDYHNSVIASADCMLLSGRMGEEGFLDHWAEMAKKDGNPQVGFARHIMKTKKLVFSKTLSSVQGENAELVKGDLATEVKALKTQSGENILAWGGARFVSSLLAADLVDELHLIVNPCALGEGLPIFRAIPKSPLRLELLSSTAHAGGIVLSKYARSA